MTTSRRLLACLFLALTAGFVAELLLGDLFLDGVPGAGEQVGMTVMYCIYYGSAAVLIRELACRWRRGWPTVLALALVHGLIEEGFVDRSLYDPGFAGGHLLDLGWWPWLGTGVPWALYVLTLHTVWSITVPIVIAQAVVGMKGSPGMQTPWLRHRVTLLVPVALYVAGSSLIAYGSAASSPFTLRPVQVVATLVALAGVVVVAGLVGRRPQRRPAPWPRTAVSIAVGAVLASGFLATRLAGSALGAPTTVALILAFVAVAFAVAPRLEPTGLAAGALAGYAWFGLLSAWPSGPVVRVEQATFVAVAAVLVTLAVRCTASRVRPGRAQALDVRSQ